MPQFNKVRLGLVAEQLIEVDSTNAELVRRLAERPLPPAGFLLSTQRQSKGRGQTGKQWHSEAGANWTASLLLYPTHLAADQAFRLSQVCALAVRDVVVAMLANGSSSTNRLSADSVDQNLRGTIGPAEVQIKWPNDILVDSRKIAGILIQTGIQGRMLSWAILGIGLNVNQRQFPSGLARVPTSLALETGKTVGLEDLQSQLLARLGYYYNQTASAHFTALDGAYQSQLFQRDQQSLYRDLQSGETFEGILRGTDQQGRLLLDGPEGRLTTYDPQSIAFL